MGNQPGSWSILCVEENYDTYLFTKALVSRVKDRQIQIEWSSSLVEGLAKLFYANKQPGGGYDVLLINYQFIQQNGSETLQTIVNEYQVPVILFNSQETDIDFNDLRLYQWPIIHQSRLSPALIEGVITNAIELHRKDIILQQYKEQVERDAIELRHNASELEAVFNAQTDAVIFIDSQGIPVRINPAVKKMLGFDPIGIKPKELARRLKLSDPENRGVTNKALRGEPVVDVEHQIRGQIYLTSSTPILNRDGQITGAVTVLKNITERKQAEDAIALSRKKLQIALTAARMGAWEYNPEGDWMNLDENAQKLYSSPGGWISYKDLYTQKMHPMDIALMVQALEDACDPSGSGEYQAIYRIRQDDGSWRWLQAWGQMEFQGEGPDRHPVIMIGSSQDISEQKRTEAALAYGASLLENVHDAIIATDLELKVTYWNKAAEELYGYSSEEVLGMQVNEILKSEFAEDQHIQVLRELIETGRTTQEVVQSTKAGRRLIVQGKAISTIDSHGNVVGYVHSVRDLTQGKQAEEALRESEARFRTMADGTPVMIWVHNASGVIEFVNCAWTDYFGVSLDEVRAGRWQVLVHPDFDESYSKEFVKCSLERKDFRAVALVRRGDGAWRWVDSHAQPRFSDDGTFLGMVGSSLDITERIEAENELKKYTHELERSNQALQDFTTIASHDLQEPLRKIRSFGELLQDRYNDHFDQNGSHYLNRMVVSRDHPFGAVQSGRFA
jgi:PAS domain S-box-containing protein